MDTRGMAVSFDAGSRVIQNIIMGNFRLGSLLGFEIRIAYSFLLLLGLVVFGGVGGGGTGALVIVLLAFGSVLLHELGHAVTARHLGVRIREIELNFFGGAAKMLGMPRTAGHEIAIAAAGPAVSFALSGAALLTSNVTGSALLLHLAWINLLVGAFNMMPALPMDGGRILRALLSRRMGFLRATEVSVKVARFFAFGMFLTGIVYGPATLVVLAVMIVFMSFAELNAARFRAFAESGPYGQIFGDPRRFGGGYSGSNWSDQTPEWTAPRVRTTPVEVEYLPPARTENPPPTKPNGSFRVRGVRW